MIRSPSKFFFFVICRSYIVEISKHTQLLILREALIRIKEVGANSILCWDPYSSWKKLFDPSTKVNWKNFPTLADIRSLSFSLACGFFEDWHPLAKEHSPTYSEGRLYFCLIFFV